MIDEVHYTGRGFKRFAWVPSEYGGGVEVSESSAAGGPHVWLRVQSPAELIRPDGETPWASREMRLSSAHLTVANAIRVRDQLTYLVEHHYQLDPDGWARREADDG